MYAAAGSVNTRLALSRLRWRDSRMSPTDFVQPKTSSTRLRLRRLSR
jgi:hypothetical protein